MKPIVPTSYRFGTKDLCKALDVSCVTLLRWEKMGVFTAPRTIGNHRIFTKKQIEEIVKAFTPGNICEWHFKS